MAFLWCLCNNRCFVLPGPRSPGRACYLGAAGDRGCSWVCFALPASWLHFGRGETHTSPFISFFWNKATEGKGRMTSLCSPPCPPWYTVLVGEDGRFRWRVCQVLAACKFQCSQPDSLAKCPCSRHLLLLLIPAQVHQAGQCRMSWYSLLVWLLVF